jgi:hypothetical protein
VGHSPAFIVAYRRRGWYHIVLVIENYGCSKYLIVSRIATERRISCMCLCTASYDTPSKNQITTLA